MSNEPALGTKPSNAPSLSSSYQTFVRHYEDFREGYASIEVTTRLLPFDRRFHSYRWIGPRTAPVRIYRDMLGNWTDSVDETVKVLPWKLRKLSESRDWRFDSWDFVRIDGALWLPALLTEARHILRERWGWFTARMVLTLMIWGFASVEPYCQPRWKDVRWPKKVSKS